MNMNCWIRPLTVLRIRAFSAWHDTRGVVLPLTFFILVLLAGLVAALLSVGATESQISANLLRGTQAFNLAEAGAERAIAQFVADSSLVGNATCSPCPGALTTPFPNLTLGSVGTYTVTYQPIGPSTVLVKSTGTSSIGNVAQNIQVVVTAVPGTPGSAVFGDDVEITGTNTICGSGGSIFGNTKVVIADQGNGNAAGNCGAGGNNGGSGGGNNKLPWIDKTASAPAGATCTLCTDSKHIGVLSGSGTNGTAQSLPPNSSITDAIYKAANADFIMDSSGHITIQKNPPAGYNVGDVFTCGEKPGCTSGPFKGWYHKMSQPGDWHFEGSGTPPNGTYLAPLEISVKSTVGTALNPWKATLLVGDSTPAPGYPAGHPGEWEIYANNSFIVPAGNPLFPNLLGVGGTVLLEGTNTTLTGTLISTTKSRGLTTADDRPSVLMDQGVTLNGNIISDGQVLISGTSKIVYNPVGGAGAFGAPQIISWTRVAQ
jgi:Tfp pilus assembly protein PilX